MTTTITNGNKRQDESYINSVTKEIKSLGDNKREITSELSQTGIFEESG
jgi:hypothetical protein